MSGKSLKLFRAQVLLLMAVMNYLKAQYWRRWQCFHPTRTGLNLCCMKTLTLLWRRSLSYGNQSIDLLCKSKYWFLYHRDLRHKRVKILEKLMNLPNRIGFTIETLKTYTVVQPSIDWKLFWAQKTPRILIDVNI